MEDESYGKTSDGRDPHDVCSAASVDGVRWLAEESDDDIRSTRRPAPPDLLAIAPEEFPAHAWRDS